MKSSGALAGSLPYEARAIFPRSLFSSHSQRLKALLLLAASTWCAAACSPFGGSVTRVFNGRTEVGYYIPSEAYAHYTLGIYLESAGQFKEAEQELLQALAYDTESPELWSALARIRCTLPEPEQRAEPRGWTAVQRALKLDPNYEPAWRSKAHCLLSIGDRAGARRAAKRAFKLDPNQEAIILLIAELHRAGGEPAEAQRWLSAWALRHPGSIITWQKLRELAQEQNQTSELAWIDKQLSAAEEHHAAQLSKPQGPGSPDQRRPGVAPSPAEPTLGPTQLAALDRLLDSADSEQIRKRVNSLGLTLFQAAFRAYERGLDELAASEARFLLAADPSHSDARVLLLLLGSPAASADLWATPAPLSPKMARLLSAAIERAAPPAP